MNTSRDRLDEVIDHVAARLTHVDDNDALASHIINALPERVTWFDWLCHSWATRLAMIAIVVAAGMVWGNRRQEGSAPGASPIASFQPITTPTALVASVREAEPNRTMPLESALARDNSGKLRRDRHLEPLEPVERREPERVDHARSLPSLVAVAALNFDSLAPDALPATENLVLESLVIADLPLTAEPISPR